MPITIGRPLLSAAAAGAMALSLAGGVTAARADDPPISIAFVSGPLSDSFFPPLYKGADAKYGRAPVGVVSTGPSVVDAKNIDKAMKVFDTYPDTIGSK
jgi:ABC-type sugar transport system substrate-binding protein